MRKLSLLLLLATAAAPAMAAGDNDRGDRHQRKAESSERSEHRAQRANDNNEQRSARPERADNGGDQQRGFRAERSQANHDGRQGVMERIREHYQEQSQERRQAATAQSDSNDGRTWRRGDRLGTTSQSSTDWQARERRVRTIPDSNVYRQQREAFQTRHRRDYRDGNYTRWTNHWRNDRRYDWRRWRDHNRSIFRIGIYYDPFGYSYRRWSIGSFLNAGYYGSSYWLNDPWQYRLPPAYGPYRWVRYWDDALLVNIYTGEVVDVINNFFW